MEETTEGGPMSGLDDARNHVQKESYPLPENPYISRCIDGRYLNDDGLPALAIPGADIGQMVMLFAAANLSHSPLDPDKAFNALIEVVGGVENIRIHTDSHNKSEGIAAGCSYFAHVKANPKDFGVTEDQVSLIEQRFEELIKQGAKRVILEGDHHEEGVLIVSGEKSIKPEGKYFVFHQGLIDERNKKIISELVKNKQFLGSNFLSALAKIPRQHLDKIIETLKPKVQVSFYDVNFEESGSFDVVASQKGNS
ncbi:hypothetical protein A3F29_04425 [Candidatus Roizmanbacteria bacterium RIFCSPHIGHO2_12_FULL_33_9]|uniref:Uncharacterized protein n=1 Tax=Candidatus Roizmanbacteria bacterium RIFCSPHIGHO2_12_FULL_33_9 TaxID=1802045 RepID=A0A1F7HID1_9BACT|nr:MAG: hypothetical protein A3F29_04425 [Candidatus Roizmanbacteria bacterium RIFCSPHIGHO2_12_FULL_33_9]